MATIESRIRAQVLALVTGLLTLISAPLCAGPVLFPTGSFIIPMDTAAVGQDDGMLRAYGLVYALLRNRVPVHWVIKPTKIASPTTWATADFTVPGGTVRDLENSVVIGGARDYRGGPFAIHASNAATARPIIDAWLVADSVTVVHEVFAGSITLPVARTLIAAPRIGILLDGSQDVAFFDLNVAGITDASDAAWNIASADLLTEAQVAGATTTNHADGALFSIDPPANGAARFCHLSSMHYNVTATTPEVVQEVRNWLQRSALTHAYMQCASTTAFENEPIAGFFLTTQGLEDSGAPTATPKNHFPADPYLQLDGLFSVDTGAVDSMQRAGGLGSFKTGVRTLINEDGASLLTRIVLLSGNLDGDLANGQVTYLGGHDYSSATPISANPQTNGVRLYLNSLFESGCATSADQGPLSLVASAPAVTDDSTITFMLTYNNPGPRPAEFVVLTDRVPVGTVFANSPPAEGGVHSAGVVTWNIGTVAAGATVNKQFTANVTSGDGIYANAATIAFAHLTVNRITSNTSSTEVDTSAPTVTITGGPNGATNNNAPTFTFTVSAGGSPTTAQCRVIDNPAPPSPPAFGACTTATSYSPSPALADGNYTFQVRAFDDAGNFSPTASRNFSVDTTAPVVIIPGPPTNPTITTDLTPTLQFSVSAGGSPVTSECRIVQLVPPVTPAFETCSSPYTATSALNNGNHAFEVRATDQAGNIGNDSFAFSVSVDGSAPQVTIFGPPTNAALTSDTTPTFFFSVSAGGTPATSECRILRLSPPPSTPAFTPCNSPYTAVSVLADGSYILEVLATDQLAQTGNDSFAFVVDTAAPTVAAIDSVASADWTPPALEIGVAVTKVLLTFAEDMSVSGAGSVLAPANWLAAAAGPNLTIDTNDCSGHAGDDTALPVTAREYNGTLRTVALSVASGTGVQSGRYRLFACPTLTDLAGNALDGAANGGGAEAYVLDFTVIVDPRVVNPNFDAGLGNWIPSGPLPAAWSPSGIDGEGQPFSGAARLNTVVGNGASWHLDQCVNLNQLDSYGLSSLVRITSSVPGAPSVSASVAWTDAAACAGNLTLLSSTPLLSGNSGGAWLPLTSPTLRPPPGSLSFMLSFEVLGGAASTYTVEIDRVSYQESDLIFANGFQ